MHKFSGLILLWLAIPTGGVTFTWVMVGAFAVAVARVFFLPMLLRIDRRTALGFCLSGAVYVSGVLGMEFVSSLYFAEELWEAYGIAATIEEDLEIAGLTLFLTAVLRHLVYNHPVAELRLC